MTQENPHHRRELLRLLLVVTAVVTVAAVGVAADTTTTQGHGHGDGHHGETTSYHGGTDTTDGHHGATETTRTNRSSGGCDHHSNESTSHHSDGTSSGHHAGEGESGHHDQNSMAWLISVAGLVAIAALPVGSAYWFGKRRDRFSDVDAGPAAAIGLILVSAAVHLYLFLQHNEVVMLLAGLGFVGAVVLFFLGVSRRLLYAVGIPYVVAQLVLWWSSGMPHLQSYGLFDKAVQVLLLVVLAYLLVTE